MKGILKSYRHGQLPLLSVILLIVIIAGITGWRMAAGTASDDENYRRQFAIDSLSADVDSPAESFYFAMGPEIKTVSEAFSSCVNHYKLWYNGRFANFMMFFSNLLPQWTVNLLHGCATAAVIALIACSACPRGWRRPLPLLTSAWGVFMLFPWYSLYASSDFFFNYIWSTLLILLIYRHISSDDKANLSKSAAYTLLSLIGGMMHEGLSTVASVAFVSDFVINRRGQSKLPVLLGFVVGTVVAIMSPGFRFFLGDKMSGGGIPEISAILKRTIEFFPLAILLLVSLPILLKAGIGNIVSWSRRNIFWLLLIALSVPVGYRMIGMEIRTAWLTFPATLILLMKAIAKWGLYRRPHNGLSLLATVGLTAWLCGLCTIQARLTDESRAIESSIMLTEDKRGYIPVDHLTTTDQLPSIYRDMFSRYGRQPENEMIIFKRATGIKGERALVTDICQAPASVDDVKTAPYYDGTYIITASPVATITFVSSRRLQLSDFPTALKRLLLPPYGRIDTVTLTPGNVIVRDSLYFYPVRRQGIDLRGMEPVTQRKPR